MPRPLVLLVHPDAISRIILVEMIGTEFRWLLASRAAEVPRSFDEPPSLVLADAEGVPELDALCAGLRTRLPGMRSVALTRDYRARLPSVDTLLVMPVPIDRVRQTLLLEARLCKHVSGPRAVGRPAEDHDPDDVVTPRIRGR